MYESAERDAIILTKKNEKIFGLDRKIKALERKIRDLTQSEKSDGTERLSRLRITESADEDVLIDGHNESLDIDNDN